MSPRRPGAPTLGARARSLRIKKGLTQADAGRLISKSQAYISQLEQDLRSREDIREYHAALDIAPSQERTAGGLHKAGRARNRANGLVDPKTFRGAELKPGFDYAATLPQGRGWSIIAICRTAATTELAFLVQEASQQGAAGFGIVGFHLVNGEMKRSQIIRITEEYDDAASAALVAFAEDNIVSDDADEEADELDDDDAFVSDDED